MSDGDTEAIAKPPVNECLVALDDFRKTFIKRGSSLARWGIFPDSAAR